MNSVKTLIIEDNSYTTRYAIFLDDELWGYGAECKEGGRTTFLNNVYKGKIVRVVKSLSAAFVDLGQGLTGYLSMTPHMVETLKEGDYVMCQVKKEKFGAKDMAVEISITLPGKYLVYLPYGRKVSASGKIKEDCSNLKNQLKLLKKGEEGFILRTASILVSPDEVIDEVEELRSRWIKLQEDFAKKGAKCGLIYEESSLLQRLLRDHGPNVDRVITDNYQLHLENKDTIEYYDSSSLCIFEKFQTQGMMETEAIYPKVNLKNGSFLVIENTEAMTVIDVNSGKFVSTSTPEENAFSVNMEAAKQVCRHIMLRNMSGVIIVDFIDMQKEEHKNAVLKVLEDFAKLDKAKTTVHGMTKLGLVEITRKRRTNLSEDIVLHRCPHCRGTGKTFTSEYHSYRLMDSLRKTVHSWVKSLTVTVNPELYDYVKANKNYTLCLKELFPKTSIHFQSSPTVESYLIEYK